MTLDEVSEDTLAEALITEYTAGAGIGWHRDAFAFGMIVGISLASSCTMRLRKYDHEPRQKSLALTLDPRSLYIMKDDARYSWQHHIPPTEALRYSITFRTLR